VKVALIISSALAVLAFSAEAALAQAACTVAKPPARPTVVGKAIPPQAVPPPCVETNKCKDKDVVKYNADLAAYNAAVDAQNGQIAIGNAYIKAMDEYADQVKAYMGCERDAIAAALALKS
jgi:hypothetical protein